MIQPTSSNEASRFAQKLNLFDATMIVMSGIIGTGIFINSYIVAQAARHFRLGFAVNPADVETGLGFLSQVLYQLHEK